MCRFACPVAIAEARETVTPAKKMELIYLIGRGYKEPKQELIEAIYKCTGCLHCFTYCGHKNMIMHVYYSARNELKNYAGENIRAVIEKYRDNYMRTSNPFGDKLRERFKELQSENYSSGRDVLYFPGCTEANFYPETTNRVYKLIKKIYPGAGFIQSRNYCCGYPLLNVGLMDEFLDNARMVSEELNKFKLVLTNCPACAFILKNAYAGAGIRLKPEVLTIIEVISSVSDRFSERKDGVEVIYHDPCYLARYQHIISEPRTIIKRLGYAVIEYAWNGIDSECCGASLSPLFPELSDKIAKRRINQLNYSNYTQKRLITACPSCRRRFSKTLNVEVYDLAEEIAKNLL